jgi:hypothetical protein
MSNLTRFGCFVFLCLAGCEEEPPRQTAASVASAAVVPSAASTDPRPNAVASAWPVPTGVSLAIFPGKGVGPIRIGATVATIERLMGRECEVKTETLCGYNGRAVDFELEDGKTVRIRVQRTFRKNLHLEGASYGMFNGGFANGIRLEMLETAVKESFGAPQRSEAPPEPGPWNTVERATYDGMTLEFDRLGPDRVVLGGVVIEGPTGSAQ